MHTQNGMAVQSNESHSVSPVGLCSIYNLNLNRLHFDVICYFRTYLDTASVSRASTSRVKKCLIDDGWMILDRQSIAFILTLLLTYLCHESFITVSVYSASVGRVINDN